MKTKVLRNLVLEMEQNIIKKDKLLSGSRFVTPTGNVGPAFGLLD